ncbi:phosphoribosylglycinamide synthetase C domain-containing protein [Secundilactobacillus similis]|uniref:phosphoribosylglycinamide synthetase C domain-containing protein n=1 Tax=Secundilactobacillus similis TaxID=414682 RepID=UPI0021E6DDF9|nr:phosphoribosylglycinamide synthetase C domain-containing protein [Secundilactobacillus similis]
MVNGRPLPQFDDPQLLISYAGVATENSQVVSHGGRVLMVTAKAADLKTAQQQVNQTLDRVVDASAYTFRHDIGFHAIEQ